MNIDPPLKSDSLKSETNNMLTSNDSQFEIKIIKKIKKIPDLIGKPSDDKTSDGKTSDDKASDGKTSDDKASDGKTTNSDPSKKRTVAELMEEDLQKIENYQEIKDIAIKYKLWNSGNIRYKELFVLGYQKLNDFQRDILKECIKKGTGGLSLPLGSGKTICALILSLYQTMDTGLPVLIVAGKSLIASWAYEIKKFFGDKLRYQIIHPSVMKEENIDIWRMNTEIAVVLTTPDVLSKYYKEHKLSTAFIEQKFNAIRGGYVNIYRVPDKPYLSHTFGGGVFYSVRWGCLIVDEIQKYTNINTLWCQSISALSVQYRWALSGTMFDEPKEERVLGYHMILNIKGVPRNLPATKTMIYSEKFQGMKQTLVFRETNQAFIPPKINEQIITHNLTFEETKIYTSMKEILIKVKERARQAQLLQDMEELKKFSSYKLVMIMYLRQVLVCPMIPIASIAIDASDLKNKSELSEIIMDEVGKLGINHWLNSVDAVKSSRIQKVLEVIEKHQDEKMVIFSCFSSFLDILQYFLPSNDNRKVLRMNANMNMTKRGALIEEFKGTTNGILLLTYTMGAEGLNLQFAATVLLVDFWWNAAKTQQAIGRVFRFGQIAKQVNIYFFSGNTGIEKILFEKQSAKLKVLKELETGGIRTKVPHLNMNQVIRMIEMADNKKMIQNIRYY